jgi:hypothetical protein
MRSCCLLGLAIIILTAACTRVLAHSTTLGFNSEEAIKKCFLPFEQEHAEFSTFHRVSPIVNSGLLLLTSLLFVIPCTILPFEMKATEITCIVVPLASVFNDQYKSKSVLLYLKKKIMPH